MSWFSFLLLLFALSFAAVGLFHQWARQGPLLDKPNQRSSHIIPTPRGGGIVIAVGWCGLLVVLSYYQTVPSNYQWLILPIALLTLTGFWEDHQGLPIQIRFMSQAITCALTLVLLGQSGEMLQSLLFFPLPLYLAMAIVVLGMMWLINLFNFMDGLDGLAAMQAIFIFSMGGYILFDLQAYGLATLAWGLVGLLSGFLAWNWPPAKIFMGDSGSYFLGFMVGLYTILSYQFFAMPISVWFILSSLFWFDATLTLGRRLLARQILTKPHRSHAYQRLTLLGWSHQQVLGGAIILNIVLSSIALLVYKDPSWTLKGLGLMGLVLSVTYAAIELAVPMFNSYELGR